MSSKLGAIKVITQTSKIHSGTVIFLHGSGDTGSGIQEWIQMLLKKDMSFPQLKVLFPTAPTRPYTPMGGEHSHVWFDRLQISADVPEDLTTIDSMARELSGLVNKEVEQGIPLNRIVIGGFSMGGAMAMHLGFRFLPQLRGVFALSSFLNDNSSVYEMLKSKPVKDVPPLFMCHGDRDELVPDEWGKETFNILKQLGVNGQFHIIKDSFHELRKSELLKLIDWINEILPPTSAS